VVTSIGPEVQKIIIIDDACPEKSGQYVHLNNRDPRVEVIFHSTNLGVGGAVKTGYLRALNLKSDLIVKVDGDGQMDTTKIKELVDPISKGLADYTKGNRFFDLDSIQAMPKVRILGNIALSFLAKLSSGYWQVFDPNNGFTAISQSSLKKLNLQKIDNRYFFESDMLFRLNTIKSRVLDVDMPAIYGNQKSNLRISRVIVEFPLKHFRNFLKRIIYSYYLRDFNLASVELPVGIILFFGSMLIGIINWAQGINQSHETPTGTLILITLGFLSGLQLILAFLSFDTNTTLSRNESYHN
jgi:hypothetical protein